MYRKKDWKTNVFFWLLKSSGAWNSLNILSLDFEHFHKKTFEKKSHCTKPETFRLICRFDFVLGGHNLSF